MSASGRILGVFAVILGVLYVSQSLQLLVSSKFLRLIIQVITAFTLAVLLYASVRIPRKPFKEAILRGGKLISFTEARKKADLLVKRGRTLFFGFLVLPITHASSHFALIGATGSGKTITLRLLLQSVLPQIGKNHDVRALVYDAKGEMEGIVRSIASDTRIYNLNPFSKESSRWDLARDVNCSASCLQLAVSLIPDEKKDSQPYFLQTARHLLSGLLIVFNNRASGAWTLRDILLGVGDLDRLKIILSLEEETKNRLLHFSDNRTLDNVYSTLITKLQNYEFIAAAWEESKTSISLRDFLDGESIILLPNSEVTREAIDEINRVIFKRLTELILASTESSTRQTWIVLDEVRQAGKLDSLNTLLTKGRSKGACCVLGFQDIEGMRSVYGREEANELIGQCHNKAVLKLLSPETAEWASRIFGEYESLSTKKSESQSTFSLFRGSVSSTKNRSSRRSVIPSEFMNLPSTNPDNGLTGFYSCKDIGSYSVSVSGASIDTILAPSENLEKRTHLREVSMLKPWNDEDLVRLGLLKLKAATLNKPSSSHTKRSRKRGLM